MKHALSCLSTLVVASVALGQNDPRPCGNENVVFDFSARATPAGGERIAVGDLFQNGYDDIVTVEDDVVRGLRSIGDGRFAEFLVSDDLGIDPVHRIWLYDIDGDGWLDLLALSSTTLPDHNKELAILLADQAGGFGEPLLYDLAARSEALAVLDFQLDGSPDLALVVNGQLFIYTLNAEHELVPVGDSPFSTSGLVVRLEVGDINSDGADDLLAVYTGSVAAHMVSTDNQLSLASVIPNQGTRDAQFVDMNGDGILDIVYSPSTGISNRPVNVHHGLGDGTFALAIYTFDHEPDGQVIAAADFNSDGRGDLLVRDSQYVYVSRGEREFERVQLTNLTTDNIAASGDFNGDDRADIVGMHVEAGSFDEMIFTAISGCVCPSDFDDNGATDATDLAVMLAGWGGADADLNDDDTTNSMDIALLLAAWGACP